MNVAYGILQNCKWLRICLPEYKENAIQMHLTYTNYLSRLDTREQGFIGKLVSTENNQFKQKNHEDIF